MTTDNEQMLITLTTGGEDRGSRATLAFATGVAALMSGVPTTIFLTMGGTFWSRKNASARVAIDGFGPLSEYVEQYIELGGSLMVCSPCNEFYCAIASDSGLIEGAEICGLAHVVDLALRSSTLTF